MTGLPRFPDIQQVLVDLLEPFAGAGNVDIETPADLRNQLPFIRVRRIGGPTTRLHDYARVEVDVFHSTYTDGEPLAQQVMQYLTGTSLRSGLAVVDRVECESAPVERTHPDERVRKFSAEYMFVSRRHQLIA